MKNYLRTKNIMDHQFTDLRSIGRNRHDAVLRRGKTDGRREGRSSETVYLERL